MHSRKIMPILLFNLIIFGCGYSSNTAKLSEDISHSNASDIAGQATVIDGDTIEIHTQRVRLHGIDAPESSQMCERGGQQWSCGQRAALALSDQIGRSTVRCDQRDIDRYGRIVAVCFAAGKDLNAWMVRQGWALAYRQYSNDYVGEEDVARQSGAGIWVGSFVHPWGWRRGERLETASSTEPRSASNNARGSARDHDCSDFASWREAQDFFEAAGAGDPHRLDRDNDGIACEGLR